MKLWARDLDSACVCSCSHAQKTARLIQEIKVKLGHDAQVLLPLPIFPNFLFKVKKTNNFSVVCVKKKKKKFKESGVHFFRIQRRKIEECPVCLVHISLVFRIARSYLSLQDVQK